MKHYIYISENLNSSDLKKLLRDLSGYSKTYIIVDIKKVSSSRTNEQNAFYWGVVIPTVKSALIESGNEWGNDVEIVHTFLKDTFLPYEEITLKTVLEGESFDKKLKKETSTTKLNKKEFNEFINRIDEWLFEFFNFRLPEL